MRFLLVLALGIVGCAHADAAADRQLDDLRKGLDQTEAEQDRVNQRGSLIAETPEEKAASARSGPAAEGSGAKAGAAQRTVQIGQDERANENDDPNDPEARPEIRLQGSGSVAPAPRPRKSRRSEDPADEAPVRKKQRGDAADSAATKENR